MEKETKKSEHFVLIIDKDRERILHCLFESGFRNPIGNAIFNALAQLHGIDMKDVLAFAEEINEKHHALGWCDDPNCQFNKNKHGDGDGEATA